MMPSYCVSDHNPEADLPAKRPRAPRAAKAAAPAQSSGRLRSSPSPTNSRGPSVCDTCKKKKVACDLRNPCSTCKKRKVACMYTWMNAKGEIVQRSATEMAEESRQEKLIATRAELATLLRQVDDLSLELSLSQDVLVDLYEQAKELVQPDPSTSDIAPSKSPSPTAANSKEEDCSMPPPPPPKRKKPTPAVLSSPSPAPSRFPRAAKGSYSSTTTISSTSDAYPSPAARPSYLRAPPLPPIDLSGKVRSGRTYHFPITESRKAPMEIDGTKGREVGGDGGGEKEEEEEDSCGEDEEGRFFSLVALCGGRLSGGGYGVGVTTAPLKAVLTS